MLSAFPSLYFTALAVPFMIHLRPFTVFVRSLMLAMYFASLCFAAMLFGGSSEGDTRIGVIGVWLLLPPEVI